MVYYSEAEDFKSMCGPGGCLIFNKSHSNCVRNLFMSAQGGVRFSICIVWKSVTAAHEEKNMRK